METKCETCRFWKQDGESSSMGFCYRYAPRPAITTPTESLGAMDAIWPRTNEEEWCGAWTAKIEVE